MSALPRIELEIKGMDELIELAELLEKQADDLHETINKIGLAKTVLQAKINQPMAATND